MDAKGVTVATGGQSGFDLFRLTKSKEVVDVCPNTLRTYFKKGLRFYKQGKAIFISKSDVYAFLTKPQS
jgi:hypothetical protein